MVVRGAVGLDGQTGLVAVEEHLDEHIGIVALAAVVDHGDATAKRRDAVVHPSKVAEAFKVVGLQSAVVELHQAGECHDDILVRIAQVDQRAVAFQRAVAHVDHVAEGGALQEGLRSAVEGTGSVLDVVLGIELLPVRPDLRGSEEVVEGNVARQVGMLDAACEHEELTAQHLGIDVVDDEVLIGEERLHQSGITRVKCPKDINICKVTPSQSIEYKSICIFLS